MSENVGDSQLAGIVHQAAQIPVWPCQIGADNLRADIHPNLIAELDGIAYAAFGVIEANLKTVNLHRHHADVKQCVSVVVDFHFGKRRRCNFPVSLDCHMKGLWQRGRKLVYAPCRPQTENPVRHYAVDVNHIATQLVYIGIDTPADLYKFTPSGTFQHLVIGGSPLLLDAGR